MCVCFSKSSSSSSCLALTGSLLLTRTISLPHKSLMEPAHQSHFHPIHHFLTHQLCISSFSFSRTPSLSRTGPSPIAGVVVFFSFFSFHFFLPFNPSASHFCLARVFLASFSASVVSAGRPSIEEAISMNKRVMSAVNEPSVTASFDQRISL